MINKLASYAALMGMGITIADKNLTGFIILLLISSISEVIYESRRNRECSEAIENATKEAPEQ